MKEENAEVNTFEPAGNRGHASDAASLPNEQQRTFLGGEYEAKAFWFSEFDSHAGGDDRDNWSSLCTQAASSVGGLRTPMMTEIAPPNRFPHPPAPRDRLRR
jgi:hypothetical protein